MATRGLQVYRCFKHSFRGLLVSDRAYTTTATCSLFVERCAINFFQAQGLRYIHTSKGRHGLDEFFQKGEDLIEDAEKTGRAWLARELRHKSSEDLHKLWYVLLKERNMLLTQQHEAGRQGFIMPAPERLKKVRQSMSRIKLVIGERNKAVREVKEQLNNENESNSEFEENELAFEQRESLQ